MPTHGGEEKWTLIFPQQCKLMGSSAQNSSGVHRCRRRVRFNEVPEKVPTVPEKVWEALAQSQVRFNRVPEKVPTVPEKVWEGLVQSVARFHRVSAKVPEKVPGSLGAKPSQVQQGSGEGSGEGSGGFGAEPGQVQQGSGKGSGEGLWCRVRSGSTGFRRRFREALVQSQVRLNRVPKKVPRRRFGRLWWRVRSGSTGFRKGSGEGSKKPWCKAKSGLTGSGEGCRSQARSGSFNSRKPS